MRASNFGEPKLAQPDFTRPGKLTAPGADSRLRAGPFPLKRILVLSDLTDVADNAAWRAGLLAREHGAWLRIVHVRPWHEGAVRAQRILETLAWRLQEHLRIAVVAQSLRGSLRREIAAAASGADLLVTGGSAGRWTRSWIADIHPDTLAQHCGLPTLVVRKAATQPYQRVIAGVQHGLGAPTSIAVASGMAGGPHVQMLREFGKDIELLPREHHGFESRAGQVEARIHHLAQATPGARMKEAPCVIFTRSLDVLLEKEEVLFPDLVVVPRAAGKLPPWIAPSLPRRLLAHTRADTLILQAIRPVPATSSLGDAPTPLGAHGANVWSS
ncbi:hypothetical protein GCM10028796_01930 [Ramlibacter monticola]|uniref:Universal stress protein n=1 Tax=Ramlibacter monticola TaxID=1926872 RepID=A0A937CSI6_9BURK|nr:universal stress protein [Ramlibacter monticola]MBL0391515.1 universal stress protein [Ramlibacter monticola]